MLLLLRLVIGWKWGGRLLDWCGVRHAWTLHYGEERQEVWQNRNPPSRRTARRGKRNLKDFLLIVFSCEDYWDPSWHWRIKNLVSRRIEPVDSGLLSGRNTT
jgi:hypothetical protein